MATVTAISAERRVRNMDSIDYMSGIPIIITDAIKKDVRKRTHKKKRIEKNGRNSTDTNLLQMMQNA